MVKPSTCMGSLPSGPSGMALNGQPSQSLRGGSKVPTLHCSHPEDNFPLQCRTPGALVGLSMAVTPKKVTPDLLSPWLSTEPLRAEPKCSPRRLWSCVGTGSVVEGTLGRKWFAEPEGRKREGVGDVDQSRKMWVLSTWELVPHQRMLGSAWKGCYPSPFLLQGSLAPTSFPELLLQNNIHENWSGRSK